MSQQSDRTSVAQAPLLPKLDEDVSAAEENGSEQFLKIVLTVF
jgi:hypothetical protein